MVAAVI